jgi:hypothetical protein
MKKLVLLLSLLTLSLGVCAHSKVAVFPHVYNTGNALQVNVWNTTDRFISCSGFVYMNTAQGYRETEFFSDSVPPRFNSYRQIYLFRFGDRITSFSHSISCF